MDEFTKNIIKQLFFESSEKISEITKHLSNDERKKRFKEIKPLIKELTSICKFEPDTTLLRKQSLFGSISFEPRYKSVRDIYDLVINNLGNLKDVIKEQKINIQTSEGSFDFFINLQTLYISLSDYKSISSALKITRKDPFPKDYNKDIPIYLLGKALLEREEEWKKEVFINFFENIEKQILSFGFPGFTKLVLEVIQKHPEWKNDFENYIGKSMNLDGFIRNKELKDFPADVILSGLRFEFNTDLPQNVFAFQIQYGHQKITDLIQEGYLPRKEIIKITLDRLQRYSKPGVITGWMKIYDFLKLSQNELEDNREIFLNIINATSPQVISLSLDSLKKITLIETEFESLIPQVAFNLNNNVQKVAKDSFTFLKHISKKDKKYLPQIIASIVNNLAIHNKNLRTEIIKWLYDKKLPEYLEPYIKNLLEEDEITAFEKDLLKSLLYKKDSTVTEIKKEVITITQQEKELIPDVALKDNIYRTNAKNIIDIINNYNKTKTISEIKPVTHDYSAYIYEEKIKYCNNEIELAVYISELVTKQITSFDLEIVIEGILKFREIQEQEKVLKILDPALKVLDKVNIINPQFFFSRSITPNTILLAQFAYLWINNGKTFTFSKNTISEKIGWQTNSDMFCYKKFLALKNIFQRESKYKFLSSPIYKTGWIPPEIFAERYISIEEKYILPDDLLLALFRLAYPGRNEAWNILKNKLRPDNFYDCAVSIAITLEKEILHKSVKYFIDYFKKNPPDDLIFEMNFTGNVEIKDTKENQIFRLFNSAIRSRFGSNDAFEDLPGLKELTLSQLKIDFGTDFEKYYKEIDKLIKENNSAISKIANSVTSVFENLLSGFTGNNSEKDEQQNELSVNPYQKIMEKCRKIMPLGKLKKEDQRIIKDIIFAPNNFEIKVSCETSKNATSDQNGNLYYNPSELTNPDKIVYIPNISSIKENTSYYPQLLPYFLGHTSMLYYYVPFDINGVIFRFPPVAQIFFDTTVKRKEVDNCQDFVSSGISPYVDIRNGLEKLGEFLILKQLKQKEKVLNILIEGTKDGRLTPYDISNLFKNLFTETSKGFKYLMESVAYLTSYSGYFEMIVILTIEYILAESKEENYSRNISPLMDLLIDLLTKNKRSLENQNALKFLTTLSESKKKNSLKDKAKILLSIENKNKFPVIVEILSDILKDTQQ